MPFIRIETNTEFDRNIIEDVITQVTEQVSTIKGDPKNMILVVINTNVNVAFGGDYTQPAAAVQILNLKMPIEVTSKLVESISDILLEKFNVSPDRMYIFFQEFTQMHLVGWNRKTFTEIVGGDDLDALEKAREKSKK